MGLITELWPAAAVAGDEGRAQGRQVQGDDGHPARGELAAAGGARRRSAGSGTIRNSRRRLSLGLTGARSPLQAIPHALAGRDILGAAKTGSGKTLAFLVPARFPRLTPTSRRPAAATCLLLSEPHLSPVFSLDPRPEQLVEKLYRQRWTPPDGVGAIVITPTRELAMQIFDALRKVGARHGMSAGLLIGGKDVEYEKEKVNGMNILVCTPGRLLQHMDETPYFDCSALMVLVLDEADRILDMASARLPTRLLPLPSSRNALLSCSHGSLATQPNLRTCA